MSGRPPEPGAWRRALGYLSWLAIPLLLALLLLAASQLQQPGQRLQQPGQRLPGTAAKPRAPEPEPLEGGAGSNGFRGGGSGGGETVGTERAGGETTASPQPHRPQTFRHLTVHHLHHLWILWLWNWEAIALVAFGICLFFLVRRRLTPNRPFLAELVVTTALGLSALATALAIHQVPGPGTYVVNPVVVVDEHENSEGDRFIELERPIDHYHPPLEMDVALLLLAAGLVELSVPAGRTLARELRDRAKRRREAARARAAAASARPPQA